MILSKSSLSSTNSNVFLSPSSIVSIRDVTLLLSLSVFSVSVVSGSDRILLSISSSENASSVMGSVTLNVVPCPSWLLTSIVP